MPSIFLTNINIQRIYFRPPCDHQKQSRFDHFRRMKSSIFSVYAQQGANNSLKVLVVLDRVKTELHFLPFSLPFSTHKSEVKFDQS